MSSPPASPAPAARLHPLLLTGALVLLVLLAYAPTWGCGYVWDDDHYVTGNQTLRDLHGLWRIWFEPGAVPQYYPLVHSTFWLQYQLGGLAAGPYHLVNVLLHAAVVLLLWRTLLRLAVPGAWLAAALFALHPLQVETVAWVTERKNVLSAVGYFLALLAYLRALRWPELGGPWDRRAWDWYALATLAFAAALLSKTVTCTLPAVLVVLVWWHTGTWGRREWRATLPLLPWLLLGAGMGLATARLEREHVGAQGPEWAFSAVDRVLIAGRALWFYLGKLALPQDLCFIYARWHINAQVGWQYLLPLAFVALLVTLWLARRPLGRGPVTALALYAGTLFPALGFINVYPMRYSFVADHFAYLATVPILALAAAALARAATWCARRPAPPPAVLRGAGLAGAALLLLTLGTLTWSRTHAFADEETLWVDTLRHNPTAWIAENNLGEICRQRGDLAAAVTHFGAAIALNPQHARAHNNLALCYAEQGNTAAAANEFRASLELAPDVQVVLNLAAFYAHSQQPELARRAFLQALQWNPDYALNALADFAAAQAAAGDASGAQATVDQAQQILTARHRADLAGRLAGPASGAASPSTTALPAP